AGLTARGRSDTGGSACRPRSRARSAEADEHLAGVGPGEQVDEGLRGVLQPVAEGLVTTQSALGEPVGGPGPVLVGEVVVPADDEPAEGEVLADGLEEVARTRWRLGGVVLGDGPAQRHAPEG